MAMIKTYPVYFPGEKGGPRPKKEKKAVGKKIKKVEKPKEVKQKLTIEKKPPVVKVKKERETKRNNREELKRIQSIVCQTWGVDEEKMPLKDRRDKIKTARNIIMYFGYFHLGCSYDFIGKFLGNRDHTTIRSGARSVDDLRVTDYNFRIRLKEIEDRIKKVPTDSEKILNYNWEIYNELRPQL